MKHRIAAFAILATTAIAGRAEAAGFYLQEQSVSQQGSAFAGAVANPEDASTVFFNPAGMTQLSGPMISGGAAVLVPTTEIANTGSTAGPTAGAAAPYAGSPGGNPFDPTPVPSFYGVLPLEGGKVWLGLGVSSPFGLANDYGDTWFGRYDSTKSELLSINVSPVIAYKFNDKLSIGGGPNIQYVNARLENALPCPTLICGGAAFTPGTDGLSTLKGDSYGFGLNVGALYEINERTQVGVHYRSKMDQTVDGEVDISGLLGPLAGQNGVRFAEAELKQPDTASIGFAHKYDDRLTILGSANWFGWSNFDEIRVEFDAGGPDSVTPEEFDDSFSLALGAKWKQDEKWTFRGGVQYDQTPTTLPDRSTRTPDGDRYWLSLGATYAVNEKLSLDFAASHLFITDGDITLTKRFYAGSPVDTTVNVNGRAESSVEIFSLQANWKF
ncbi:MAG: outer membrane protein transport protein [bacterium]|nr:outer membrane protein transport protein [bacterium]